MLLSSSCSIFRLTPTNLDGDDVGDLDDDLVALTSGGVVRDDTTSGVLPRLPIPVSFLSRVTKLFAAVASARHVAWYT
jgi:hypothetical protein